MLIQLYYSQKWSCKRRSLERSTPDVWTTSHCSRYVSAPVASLHAGTVQRDLFLDLFFFCSNTYGRQHSWSWTCKQTLARWEDCAILGKVRCSHFLSDRCDVELQAADPGAGRPTGQGVARHEEERIWGWEVEWLWGQSSIWRNHWRCCKEVHWCHPLR